MLRKLIYHLLERRHYWRTVGFSELAELYSSRLLRLMAVNLVTGIVGIYMYQLGYPIWSIVLFSVCYFAVKGAMSIPSAYFVARFGPKHAAFFSTFLNIPGLIALTQLEGTGVGALVVFGLLQGTSVSLYWIAYHVAFSKAKHPDHAGKELSFMYIAEKIGTGLSPLLGGLIAFMFGPEWTMVAACVLMMGSVGPLFLTPEPVRTHQKIIFRGFNWRATWTHFVSAASVGADMVVSVHIWAVYVAVAIFGTTSNVVYAQIGGLLSISYIASVAFSRIYGVLIDRRRGDDLLKTSVIGDSLLMLSRPFVSTPLGVVFINTANEATTSGYTMPYLKGEYDMADSLPGYRIVYITLMEIASCIGIVIIGLIMMGLVLLLGDIRGLQASYVVAAFAILPIMLHGFPALKKQWLS